MNPQSGATLAPHQANGIWQTIFLNGVAYGQGSKVKMRWRLSYKVAGELRQEQGEIPALGVA
jgi:ADP-ribosylation factor-binding protein GGA